MLAVSLSPAPMNTSPIVPTSQHVNERTSARAVVTETTQVISSTPNEPTILNIVGIVGTINDIVVITSTPN